LALGRRGCRHRLLHAVAPSELGHENWNDDCGPAASEMISEAGRMLGRPRAERKGNVHQVVHILPGWSGPWWTARGNVANRCSPLVLVFSGTGADRLRPDPVPPASLHGLGIDLRFQRKS
jgi:hypothetical protein